MTVTVKSKVLFICVHNTARSQMAEAWLKHLCGDSFDAESAGLIRNEIRARIEAWCSNPDR